MTDTEILEAARKLFSRIDPVMAQLMSSFGPLSLRRRDANFESLLRIIANQKISDKSAKKTYQRIKNLCPSEPISPGDIQKCGLDGMRHCGLSLPKAKFILELAGTLQNQPNFMSDLQERSSQEAYQELLKIKGIGPWSANIFLLFSLKRIDIFPYGDGALAKALAKLYGETTNQEEIIEKWSPYRGVGAIYLWEWIGRGMPEIISNRP